MATRLYLPSSGSAALGTLPRDTSWTRPAGTSPEIARLPTSITKLDTALTTFTKTWADTSSASWCLFQFQSPPLDTAYTFNSSVDTAHLIVGKCVETSTLTDTSLTGRCRVVSNDGSINRGTVFSTSSSEFPTTAATRRISIPTTDVAAQVGDRIIVEIGVTGLTPAAEAFSLRIGDPSAVSDFAFTDGLTTDLCGWIEFSPNLSFSVEQVAHISGELFQATQLLDGTITVTDNVSTIAGTLTQEAQLAHGTLFGLISGEEPAPLPASVTYSLWLDGDEYPMIRALVEKGLQIEKASVTVQSSLMPSIISIAPTALEIKISRRLINGGNELLTLFSGIVDLAAMQRTHEFGKLFADGDAIYPSRANRRLLGSPQYVRDDGYGTAVRGHIDANLVPGDALRFMDVREISVTKVIFNIDLNYSFMEANNGW